MNMEFIQIIPICDNIPFRNNYCSFYYRVIRNIISRTHDLLIVRQATNRTTALTIDFFLNIKNPVLDLNMKKV